MTIQVIGTLVNPIEEPIDGAVIRITALDTDITLENSYAEITANSGLYLFNMVQGTFEITIKFNDEFVLTGNVQVDDSTVSPISLPDLIVDNSI